MLQVPPWQTATPLPPVGAGQVSAVVHTVDTGVSNFRS
jgi:hypothetical protein